MITRHTYGEIYLSDLDPETRGKVNDLVEKASTAAKVDEHGSWEFGAEFDRKGRGEALNWDLYGYGNDAHDNGFLIVIQIRKTRVTKWGNNTRKNYYLIGTNEDGTVFAHCVSSNVIHAAIRAEKDVIAAVQNWTFEGDYAQMLRQGDLALVPVKKPCGVKTEREAMTLEGSHILHAVEIRQNGNLYAKDPELIHAPDTHPRIIGKGWYRVQVANRAAFWKFAAPTVD